MSQQAAPPGWQITTLGEIVTFTQKPRGLRYADAESIPFVPMELIPIGNVDFDSYTLKTPDQISSGTYFEPGDILLAKITPSFENGKQGILRELPIPYGIATTEVIPFREVAGVSDKDFLFFALLRAPVRAELAGKMEGSTGRQRLGKGALESLEIPLPPLLEQRAIARALRAVQSAREARQREAELERERKAALMQHLFTKGTRGEPTKMTEIGEVPESWQIVSVGEMCAASAYGPRFSGAHYRQGGNVATLRTTDIDVDGNINYSTMPFAELELDRFAPHLLQPGDFLITRSGTCGIAAVYDGFDKPVLPGAFLIRFRLADRLSPQFLRYYINSPIGQARVAPLAVGAVQKNISGTSFQNFKIPLPSIDEQDESTTILRACDTIIAVLDREAVLLSELFHALLEELMSGRLSAIPLIEHEEVYERA